MLLFQMLVYVKLSGKVGLARKKHNYIFIDRRSYSLYKSTSFPPGPLQDSAAVIRLPGRVMIQDSQTALSYWTAPKLPGSRANKSLLYKSSGTQSAAQSQESRFHDTVRRYLGGFILFIFIFFYFCHRITFLQIFWMVSYLQVFHSLIPITVGFSSSLELKFFQGPRRSLKDRTFGILSGMAPASFSPSSHGDYTLGKE